MNVDPSMNMVVFEISGHGEPFVTSGQTRDEYCVQRAWLSTPVDHAQAAVNVTRIYSEWQPSAADLEFIALTFAMAELTYSFERPGPDGWDAAFAAATAAIAQAAGEEEIQQAAQNMQHVAEQGELLPVLWSQASPKIGMLEHLPHREVVPGRLHLAVATVAPTPQGNIGMSHVTFAGLGDRPFEEVLTAASGALINGLSINGHTDPHHPDRGQLLVLRREGSFASSAVALPDFHQQMSSALQEGRLIVALPDPDTVLVARMDSGWVDELHRAVLESPCPASELVPSLLAFDQGAPAPRLVTERLER